MGSGRVSFIMYRIMIPLFLKDEVRPVCRKACLDTFGEHAAHCRDLLGFKYRHDLVRDMLFDIFRRARISLKKEAPRNFLIDPQEGKSTLQHADVLVFGWMRGKHACVDLIGGGDFTMGRETLKAL
ncbi:auxilin-like protein [Trifolium pratense]|uniref:Auxilin-like protein n=1 Tax=Trifolium pratense TaxID=57577 RepID=A0A2K3PS25_TRIPR|nr:auxilin-like protein [Trifolium pratense]